MQIEIEVRSQNSTECITQRGKNSHLVSQGVRYIFWVRGRAIGKGIDFHDFGIRNGIDFHNFGIRNGIDFYDFGIRNGIDAFSENWY